MGNKAGIQDPLLSVMEGILSRGDERAGELFYAAYKKGAYLDSWSEYFKKEIWEEIFFINNEYVNKTLGAKENEMLPWSVINSKVSKSYLENEKNKANAGEITLPCMINCTNPCGSCSSSQIINNKEQMINNKKQIPDNIEKIKDPETNRIIFSFYKIGTAIFHSHLTLLEIFSMAFIRADIPVKYSQGFNPLPRLDIASPLSLGITARGEIASIDLMVFVNADDFLNKINPFFPEGIKITKAMNVKIKSGAKKHSVSSLLWGFNYKGINNEIDTIEVKNEKIYRKSRLEENGTNFNLERLSLLAHHNDSPAGSYFDIYADLYGNQ